MGRQYAHQCEECGANFQRSEGHVGDDGCFCDWCYTVLSKQAALDAGIPLSVIEGKTKLRDHFSQEYIDSQTKKDGSNGN